MTHPTQIFMSNPQALRVEYRLDDQRLELWWSPLAGRSTDCADRNYSSRDAHLDVFAEIRLPGCDLASFRACDYDPYHSVLHFAGQTLHIALRTDLAAVLLWAERAQAVDLVSSRHDQPLDNGPLGFAVRHTEGSRAFVFAAQAGPGTGSMRRSPQHAPGNPLYGRAELAPGQLLIIGAGLSATILSEIAAAAALDPERHLADTNAALAPHEAAGRIRSPAHPELERLRRQVVRGLHAMIDESGAYRASLKAIYYLIWVRDSGFSFAYQAAAGWQHRLPELCRLMLDNPLQVRDPGLPAGRIFGQLINRTYGKLEEDGLYYVVWSIFTQWTQQGGLDHVQPRDWELIDECLHWIEQVSWDADRGLFGEHFADETPTHGWRDQGWDHAIGKPLAASLGLNIDRIPVVRNYDVYFNLIMHSTYAMLAAMRKDPTYLTKAEALWPALQQLLGQRYDGIPAYAGQLLEDGRYVITPPWGQAYSCCVWGLTMPSFAPLADWDSIHGATLDGLIAKPEMHFINGICSAIAAADPWCYPEDRSLAILRRVAEETARPGRYLPMGGAMPEKFAAPEGNLYHDIRPQGFAMGAWLGAWSSLGLRRLPFGLALRPTTAFTSIEAYPWRGRTLQLGFGPTGRHLALLVNGRLIPGTLQIPESAMTASGDQDIRLVASPAVRLWLRSNVQLDQVAPTTGPLGFCYHFTAHGFAEIVFSEAPMSSALLDAAGRPIAHSWSSAGGLSICHFTSFGPGELSIG